MLGVSVILLVAAVIAVYGPSIGHPFVFDDLKIEQELADAASLRQLLTTSSRPVVSLTFWLNEQVGGMDPSGFRIVNIAIHVLAVVVLFDLVRRLAALVRPGLAGAPAVILGLAVALLWGLHPLNTQAVAYVVQRSESLMGLCYLLTAWCMVMGARRAAPRWPWLLAGVIVCAIGMGAKSIMATAPVVILLLDWLLVGREWKTVFRRRAWFYAGLAATWSVMLATGVLLSVLGLKDDAPAPGGAGDPAGAVRDAAPGAAGFTLQGVAPFQYLTTQAEVIPHYLRLAVWPDPLVIDYQWPFGKSIADVWLPGALIVLLIALTVVLLIRKHWLAAAGAWFFGILAPTSSFVPVADAAFEHRMYLPLIAVVVVAATGAFWLARRLPAPASVIAPAVLLLAASVALGARAVDRLADYRSNLALWAATVEDRPTNLRARLNYGVNLYQQGEREAALAQLGTFLAKNPDHGFANFQYGLMLLELGRNEEAADRLRIAVANHTTERATRFDLAQAQLHFGIALLRSGDAEAALAPLLQARQRMPEDAKTTRFTGAAYLMLDQLDSAEALLRDAVRQANAAGAKDIGADAWFNLAVLAVRRGDLDGCEAACRSALALVPDHRLAREWLARVQEQRRVNEQEGAP